MPHAAFMIDLHSHILHDLDDGARTLDEAVAMAQAAAADGVTVMAATPHGRSSSNAGFTRYSVETLQERLAALQAGLREAGVPLEVVAGTEIMGEPGALERLRAGKLLPYAGARAVLIEFPLRIARAAAEEIIFAFQLDGYRVVVAHPERYRFVQDDPSSLVPLIERGALMQLTADALLGRQGEQLRRLAELMIAHNFAQLLASDAHGSHLGRVPNLGAARARAAQLVGPAAAESLTQGVPSAILRGTPIAPPSPTPIRRRFGIF
jgi:protein-tyrosine phosphatase